MRRLWIPLLVSIVFGGCASQVEEELLSASVAMDECDLRTAHTHFAAAYAMDPNHGDAAMGFALTDVVLLPEDPTVTAALAEFGFTGALDTEALIWGSDALLARVTADRSCEDRSRVLQDNFPYPELAPGQQFTDRIRADLTAQELLDHLVALDSRLERLSAAFETAAENSEDGPIIIESSCGLGTLSISAPELYAAAGLFATLRAVITLARGYDWSFAVADTFNSDPRIAARGFASILRLVDADQVAASREPLRRALTLFDRGFEVAETSRTPVPNALIDWSRLSVDVLSDLRRFVTSALRSIDEARSEPIPFVTPELGVDVSRLFTSPPDVGSRPLWSVADDGFGEYLMTDGERFQEVFGPFFSPDPFAQGTNYQWTIGGERWGSVELAPVLDPGDRWSTLFACP